MKYGRPHAIEIFSSENRMSPKRIRMTEVGTSEVRRSKNTLQRELMVAVGNFRQPEDDAPTSAILIRLEGPSDSRHLQQDGELVQGFICFQHFGV